MRIRRRPPLPLSPPQNPNFSLQIQPQNRRDEIGLHPDGDLAVAPQHRWRSTDPTPPDPHPQQVFKEENDSPPPPPPSHKETLDAQLHNNESIGEEMERNAKAMKGRPNKSNALSNAAGFSCSSDEVLLAREKASNNGRKRRPPAVLMEGSRCSRVNGRGWRCSQQTLIGYSLCEHHLGKGRLRSITSDRVGSQVKNITDTGIKPKKKKKREKMGEAKARSVSSLLDEDDDSMETTERKMGLV